MSEHYDYEQLMEVSTENLYLYVSACNAYIVNLKRDMAAHEKAANEAFDKGDFAKETDHRREAADMRRSIDYFKQQVAWSDKIVETRNNRDQLKLPGFFFDCPF